MAKNDNHKFRVLRLRTKERSNALDKLNAKSIVLPEVIEKDSSTIHHTKRVGGQVSQFYSIQDKNIKEDKKDYFYYLTTEIFPIYIEEDRNEVALEEFNIRVFQTKTSYDPPKDIYSSRGITFFSANSKNVIRYNNINLPLESLSDLGLSSFSLENRESIKYSTYSTLQESFSAKGIRSFSLNNLSFPLIPISFEEKTSLSLGTFTIKITK